MVSKIKDASGSLRLGAHTRLCGGWYCIIGELIFGIEKKFRWDRWYNFRQISSCDDEGTFWVALYITREKHMQGLCAGLKTLRKVLWTEVI